MTKIERWEEAEGWYREWLMGDFGFDFNEFLVDKVKTLLQTEQTRIAEEVEKKKGYWQVRFEGVSDGQERMKNKHYNESFSDIKDEVLDIILSIIKQGK